MPLVDHPRADLARDFLVVRARTVMEADHRGSHELELIDLANRCRPALRAKARIHGTQTAFVVGASGEEIDVDKYGRVEIELRWDRRDKHSGGTSRRVRVAQGWAGAGFGFSRRRRRELMELIVQESRSSPIARRCRALKLSHATLYRLQKPVPRVYLARPPSPRRLPDHEREHALSVMHSPEFCDQYGETLPTKNYSSTSSPKVQNRRPFPSRNDDRARARTSACRTRDHELVDAALVALRSALLAEHPLLDDDLGAPDDPPVRRRARQLLRHADRLRRGLAAYRREVEHVFREVDETDLPF